MTEPTETPGEPQGDAPEDHATRRPGERLAKAIARAGLGSRRDAEIWIGEGRVKVNGAAVTTAAFNVTRDDRVEVDGRPLPERERTRLWLYHKPRGYVTTNRDPEGRETVFSILPPGLPRVMTIGRLDINTEGLLLLTNDGGLARVLELPETGWLRRYRVRAFGRVTQAQLDALKDGVEIDGFAYGPVEAEVERQQSDNVWLMIGLREGKNREVKRLAEHLGLAVNRLIRISFGPFQLGSLPEGEAEEVRTRTLMDQLGKRLAEEAGCDFEAAVTRDDQAPKVTGGRGGARSGPDPRDRARLGDPSQRVGRRAPIARPRDMAPPAAAAPAEDKPARVKRAAPVADRRGRKVAVERVARAAGDEAPKRVRRKDAGAAERFGAAGRPERPTRPGAKPAPRGDRPERPDRAPRGEGGERFERRAPSGDRPRERGDRPFRAPAGDRPRPERGERPQRAFGDRPQRAEGGERPARGPRPFNDRPRPERGERPQRAFGDRPQRGPRPERPDRAPTESGASASRAPAPRWRDEASSGAAERPRRPAGDRPQRSDRPEGGRPPRPEGGRPPRRDGGERPAGGRPPRGDRPSGDRPAGGGRPGGKPGGRPMGGRPGGPGGKPGGGFKPRGPGGGRPGGGGKPGGRPTGGGGRGRPGGADRRR
ncbi:pseudouridine synthase [Hansschlegelia beijingensis]|uniref:Pseudouridine synthase n=1 Tax=Hansschlegelia beijingensis TaxID=1133344 RepID=A0A7W6GG68_9HYPH|nr:pseudouridine synthase [Hansschlegelia beijingensis]MBB3974671.1 23S rRNA pseudouridine2605 synthase [Hansschlegelia beijingensis]